MPRMGFETAIPVFERSRPTSEHTAILIEVYKLEKMKTEEWSCVFCVNITMNNTTKCYSFVCQ
jgi:hypothetical protein